MKINTSVRMRFKTGEESPYSAQFRFDGYMDWTSYPPPTHKERVIRLTVGETFPPIRSANKACWWKEI